MFNMYEKRHAHVYSQSRKPTLYCRNAEPAPEYTVYSFCLLSHRPHLGSLPEHPRPSPHPPPPPPLPPPISPTQLRALLPPSTRTPRHLTSHSTMALEPEIFQIVFWSSILLVIALGASVAVLFTLDPSSDALLYAGDPLKKGT